MSLEPDIRSSEVELGPRLPERASNERRVFSRLKMLYGVDSPSGMNLVHYNLFGNFLFSKLRLEDRWF